MIVGCSKTLDESVDRKDLKEGMITLITPDGASSGTSLRALGQHSELIKALAMRSIRSRYRRTRLGILWAFVQPLAYMIVINMFFGKLLRFDTGDIPYPLHLLTGLIAFQLFTKGLSEGANSIGGNGSILGKIYIPPIVFPAASILSGSVDFIFPALLLVGFLFYYQVAPSWSLIYLPIILFSLFVLFSATQIFMSVVAVRFKDMRMAVPVVSQLMFFGTPIFYPISMIPEKFLYFFALNPMVGVIDALRWSVLGKAVPPNPGVLLLSLGMIVLIVAVAITTFRKLGSSLNKYM